MDALDTDQPESPPKTLLDAMQQGVGVTPHDFKVASSKEQPHEQEQDEAVTAAVLAKRLNVVDYESGFAVRNCEGPRPFLNWQAGLMISERRYLPTSVTNLRYEWQTVSLFRLLGYGTTQDEAVLMAKKAGRNGK